ncbi:MAG: DNA polymerase III subunit epsilon [Pseudomonadales bacterium]
MRQIVLDTETTGLETAEGHRIIEIGGVELINRRFTGRQLHKYVNPNREIDDGAFEVHGISAEFLADKPTFAELADEILEFLSGAELIIHNAPFDVSFLDHEFSLLSKPTHKISNLCRITDSLALARHRHPGQKNSLDALCRRYQVDNSARTLHGALLDAEILADVYLLMTGGQTALFAADEDEALDSGSSHADTRIDPDRSALKVIEASPEDLADHEAWLDRLDAQAEHGSRWRRLLSGSTGSTPQRTTR